MTDKEFFKIVKKGSSEYADDITNGFPFWVLKIFFPKLSDEEIENAVTDLGGNDESIDAFIITPETKTIHIIQCKSAKSERQLKACKKEWLSYLYDVPNKLKNTEYIDSHKNARVKDIAAEFAVTKRKKYQINFHFFHLGYLPNYKILESYADESSFEYYGLDEIKEQYLEYQSRLELTDPPEFYIHLTYNKKPVHIPEKIGSHHTLISIITGDELVRLREKYKYKLFDKNIRFSLGLNKINKSIIDSALNKKDDFYFFNNGLTITSISFKPLKDNRIKVERPQIINGAQTVDSIYEGFRQRYNKLQRILKDKEKAKRDALREFSRIKVLFRIIQTDVKENIFETNVIRYNNTQNSVQVRDFYANNPEQKELQKLFCEEGYFYEIKRGERNYIKKNKHNQLEKKLTDFKYAEDKIDIEKLASLYMAYDGIPNSNDVGAKKILNDDDLYELIFGSSVLEVNEEKVKDMILAYNMYDLIDNESKIVRSILRILLNLDQKPKDFPKIQKSIQLSLVYKTMVKNKFETLEKYNNQKDRVKKHIRKYQSFTQGKYVVLAIFKLIIDECGYYDSLIKHSLYKDKDFIRERMVKQWLPISLDALLIPEYEKIVASDGISMNAFYLRSQTFENIKKDFYQLEFNKDKSFTELFPLEMTSQ